ncbi:siderophore-interacting protein [Frigoribacterium sp. 2-23]|uniref:siderophore-interacting protein n=1 Tax=Frigoribacterium sp. 2-23 TaxID=3415006 RepID=UPI003C7043DB
MLTTTRAAETAVRAKPSNRPYRVRVARVRRLSPSFVRITFTGDDLGDFADIGYDQRLKVVLPIDGTGYETFPQGEWWPAWRDLPDHERNTLRTYTARAIRRHLDEVDVDFVVHGDAGPASAWVSSARVGDELMLIGPDATSGLAGGGVEWNPGTASTVLLAGDETAAPAICAILEQLPRDARGCVFIEVPTAQDELDVNAPVGVDVHWIPRERTGAAYGDEVIAAVRAWTARYVAAWHRGVDVVDVDVDHDILWDVPAGADRHGSAIEGDFYAWFAGEAGAIKTLRRFLVSEVGIDRRQVAFMGYWRQGRSEN